MIILYLNDGLGNQMFQFALYRKLQASGKEICIYDLDLRRKDALHNGLELVHVFNLHYNTISQKDFRRYDTRNFMNHVARKLFYERKYPTYEEKNLSYKPEVFLLDNICLKGYWQSEKYFQGIETQVRKDFTFPQITDEKNCKLLEMIQQTPSVAVHVRRGDYLNSKYKTVFGNVCTESYYQKALQYISERLGYVKPFIFSNDIEWCKKFFTTPGTVFVEGNTGINSYKDMYLMSQCKHQIIANSSFSWWAAWLNSYKDKIVLSPSHWLNKTQTQDIICKDWIKIK